VLQVTSPQMAPLYSGLSLEDSSAIVKELKTQNVPFDLRGDGETILVPRDQITSLRMTLAGNGLPTHGQVGYEIFDKQSTLGATSFVQNINAVRALEGELARTVSSLARVKSARIHLVLPQRQLFQRQAKNPSAAVVLSVLGQLSPGEVRAIQHLIASAVEGMLPNEVSIIDDSGELLASGSDGSTSGLAASDLQERTTGIENRLRTRVEDLLGNVVGPGHARVEVTATLDTNTQTTTSESFDPNGQVVRSTQTRDVANNSTSSTNGGPVSVSNQLPGAQSTSSSGPTDQSSQTEQTTNYEISKTTQTQVTEPGGIKRLSVAVVVDGTYSQDAKGNTAYTPRPRAELDQIKALVSSAVGFDAQRGDQIQVVNMQFAARPDLSAGTSAPGLFNFTRDDLFSAAQMGVTLLIALALILFVLRPLLRRALTPESEPFTLPQTAELTGPARASGDHPHPDAAHDKSHEAPQAAQWVDHAKSMGEQQLQTLKTVGSLVDENPKQSTLVVRDWLNSAA
jgi:flagellar M-ring protein FliF